MKAYVILMIVTILYLLLASKRDLKERMVFTVPLTVLHVMWSLYLWIGMTWSDHFLCLFWLAHLMIYVLFNHFEIWGGGDSDLFLLFGDVCLATGSIMNGYSIAIKECIALCIGLILSIVISRIEASVKEEEMTKQRSVAVVPGMAAVMIALLMKGFVWRMI